MIEALKDRMRHCDYCGKKTIHTSKGNCIDCLKVVFKEFDKITGVKVTGK